MKNRGCLLFDWGDTLMKVFPEFDGPMITWPRIELMPGVLETLEKLKSDWFIAVATNAQASTKNDILDVFKKVNADHLIDEIFCFRSVGILKPEPGFFNVVHESLPFKKSDIVMIGDHYINDIEGALAFGFQGIWFNWMGDEMCKSGDIQMISHFSHLPSALNKV